MKPVNFLPEQFVRQRAARRRRSQHIVLVAAVAVGLVGWWLTGAAQVEILREQAQTLQDQVEDAHGQLSEVNILRQKRADLIQQVRIQRELAQPIQHAQVLSMLGRAMPPAVGATEMLVLAQRNPLKQAPPPGTKARRAREVKPLEPEKLKIELTGLSPSDEQVANFMANLAQEPVFSNVKLLYSRPVTVGRLIGREFRLEMEVMLDRDYRPATPTEVAHVDR